MCCSCLLRRIGERFGKGNGPRDDRVYADRSFYRAMRGLGKLRRNGGAHQFNRQSVQVLCVGIDRCFLGIPRARFVRNFQELDVCSRSWLGYFFCFLVHELENAEAREQEKEKQRASEIHGCKMRNNRIGGL